MSHFQKNLNCGGGGEVGEWDEGRGGGMVVYQNKIKCEQQNKIKLSVESNRIKP